jgi:predicted PurR-regulated permease PerM
VSWVDNLIRPLVISSAARIPFLLVMFGVLGGLAAFGLIGLFLGPVIVAVLMALWREWQAEQVAVPAATRDPTRL